jgi:hypothetical protein
MSAPPLDAALNAQGSRSKAAGPKGAGPHLLIRLIPVYIVAC